MKMKKNTLVFIAKCIRSWGGRCFLTMFLLQYVNHILKLRFAAAILWKTSTLMFMTMFEKDATSCSQYILQQLQLQHPKNKEI